MPLTEHTKLYKAHLIEARETEPATYVAAATQSLTAELAFAESAQTGKANGVNTSSAYIDGRVAALKLALALLNGLA